jgi:hypothetical protein
MSIATLKKKTAQKYNTMSVDKKQFSLNGGSRSQGYVGQSNLMRRFPMTNYRGNTARGHGGLNGSYNQTNVISGINYQNDSTIIKPSVVGTSGMIAKKYRWIRRPEPFSSTKPEVNNSNLNSQNSYITNLEKKTMACIDSQGTHKTKPISKYPCPFPRASYINYNSLANSSCRITKIIGNKTQGEYLNSLDKACSSLDAKNHPVTISRTPVVSGMKIPNPSCKNRNNLLP